MTTAQDDAAALTAATLKAAQDDLAALQTFQAAATNPATTIAGLQAAEATLVASIGDPARLAAVRGILGGYQSFLGSLATIVSMCNAAAGN